MAEPEAKRSRQGEDAEAPKDQPYGIIDLREGNRDLLSQVYSELLETHFPVEGELDDQEDMEKGLDKGDGREPEYHILVARAPHTGDLAGALVYEYYPVGDFCLMSYICVAAAHRRRGLFRSLLQFLEKQVATRTGGRQVPVLAETHMASVEDGIMDAGLRQNVLAAMGFRCLSFSYVQPPLSSEHKPVGGLRLLVKDREQVPASLVIAYLDNFSGSVFDWDESVWKSEPWYRAQVEEVEALGVVPAVAKRPW